MSSKRSSSVQVPTTAAISPTPLRRPEPTSTYLAPKVWPVFTPVAQGASSSSSLIDSIRRGGRTLRSSALRESAILAKAGIASRRRVRATRSPALE